MRKFSPERELDRIKNSNRNKILYSIIALLLIVAIGSTYALYQVRHTKSLVYTTVSDFKKRDIYLSVLVDGKTQGDFPKNNEGKIYSGIECDKPYSEAYFDNTEWKLHFTSDGPNKCTVKFVTGNLPNAPELFQGMIPIIYGDNGLMYVADTSKDWYNYQDHRWANAVLVDASNTTIKNKYFKADNSLREDIAGKEVDMSEVLQMYVWIPRYKYQLFNVGLEEGVPKQIINIAFEKDIETTGEVKCKYTKENNVIIKEECTNLEVGNWYTHPAFTFKGTTEESGTELKGIWVGKFEPSDPTSVNGYANNFISEITIIPNKTSMIYKSNKTSFEAVRNIELNNSTKYNIDSSEIDTHMMKNIEWGAVAYFSQSLYGIYKSEKTCNINGTTFDDCRVWKNNSMQGNQTTDMNGGTATGCVGDSFKAPMVPGQGGENSAVCPIDKQWNTDGVKASTTGNMYGIYDMSGGAIENMMGVILNENGDLYLSESKFEINDLNETKYYDIYSFSNSSDFSKGHLGDATKEILYKNNIWNSGQRDFPNDVTYWTGYKATWFRRGGYYNSDASIFEVWRSPGYEANTDSFRVILTAQ